MGRPLIRHTIPTRVRENKKGIRAEQRKPNLAGDWVYIGTYVGRDNPGNDPAGATLESPPWLNDFYYLSPVAFRHGLDGQTDMIGVYDLTLGAVSGDIAFEMPLRWAVELPVAVHFPVELTTNVWTIAVQTCTITPTTGEIRIFWPIVADPA